MLDVLSAGLTGTIPSQLGMLQKLKELILESNLLSGTLPPQLCQGGGELAEYAQYQSTTLPTMAVVEYWHCCGGAWYIGRQTETSLLLLNIALPKLSNIQSNLIALIP